MIGAYTPTPHFAYPGWRLRIPGGAAGGHYKGFAANYIAGTHLDAQDQYESDRAAGAASHDPVHANPGNPRGVYRGPAEVPPAPNAGTNVYRTYRYWQTERHPGTSEAPGAFPAPFVEVPYEPATGSPQFPGHNTVAAPEPADFSSPSPRLSGWSAPPASPRPSPTVRAVPSDFLPAHSVPRGLGLALDPAQVPPWGVTIGPDGTTVVTVGQAASSFADWMEQATIFRGWKNKWVFFGGIALVLVGRRA